MKQELTHIALFSAAMLAFTTQTRAQTQPKDSTLNRTVVVENEYNPQLMDADKINLLPAVEEPKATKKDIEYARTTQPFARFQYRPMPSYAAKPLQPDSPRSYLNLGYGNNGNVTGELNYLFRLSAADHLNVNAAFDGFNFRPDNDDTDYRGWKSRFYQSRIAADYAHRFRSTELGAQAVWGTQTFDYLDYYDTNKQRNALGRFQLHVRSTRPGDAWQYALTAGVHHFGRGYLYGADESNSATNLYARGGLSYAPDERNRMGLDFSVSQATYSLDGMESNGLVSLTPFYRLTTDAMRLRLGIRVDLSTGHDSGVAIAPDVTAEFPFADRYVFYASATGGTLLTDYFRFNSLTPYWGGYRPDERLDNTHVQLDAVAGFKADLGSGAWLNFYGGFEMRKNELGFFPYVDGDATPLSHSFVQGKGNNVKVGIEGSYAYKDLLDVSLDVNYRKWSTDDGLDVLLYDKPALSLRADVGIKPIPRLGIHVGYEHRTFSKGDRDAVSDLYARADYRCFDFLSLWVKGANLTNAQYQYDLGYPAQGIHFLVGTSFRF